MRRYRGDILWARDTRHEYNLHFKCSNDGCCADCNLVYVAFAFYIASIHDGVCADVYVNGNNVCGMN